jgi:hypothetical protein
MYGYVYKPKQNIVYSLIETEENVENVENADNVKGTREGFEQPTKQGETAAQKFENLVKLTAAQLGNAQLGNGPRAASKECPDYEPDLLPAEFKQRGVKCTPDEYKYQWDQCMDLGKSLVQNNEELALALKNHCEQRPGAAHFGDTAGDDLNHPGYDDTDTNITRTKQQKEIDFLKCMGRTCCNMAASYCSAGVGEKGTFPGGHTIDTKTVKGIDVCCGKPIMCSEIECKPGYRQKYQPDFTPGHTQDQCCEKIPDNDQATTESIENFTAPKMDAKTILKTGITIAVVLALVAGAFKLATRRSK